MGLTAKPKRPSAASTKTAAAKTADPKARGVALVAAGRRAEAVQATRARALLRTLRKHLVTLAQDFVEVGRLLTQLSDERLFVALGYDTFEAMLTGEKLPSRSHAFKLMRVAAVFERSDVCDYGVERAVALIAYTRATPEGADPVRLLRDNAVIGGVPVREATTAHLERARRRVLASQGATTPQSAAATRRAKTEKAAVKRVTDALKSTNLPKAAVAVSGRRVTAIWKMPALLS